MKELLLLLGMIALFVIRSLSISDNRAVVEKVAQNTNLENMGVTISAEYSYVNSAETSRARFVVDDVQKKVYITERSESFVEITYSDILGCETFCNNQKSGGVGRALAGAAIAGGVGAIVGAVTEKSKIENYYIMIYTKKITNPQIKLNLISSTAETYSRDYADAVTFSENVSATIKAILSQEA